MGKRVILPTRKPFSVGDTVSVIRTEHGWYDGALSATVKAVYERPTGTHCYVVTDDDGNDHEVNHTRDMHR